MDKEQAIEKLNDMRCHVKETSAEEQALVMAIESLKAQLPHEGTTKDAISRQQALDKLRAMQTYKLFENDDMLLVDKAEVQTELMMLPPAQPDLDEWCTDCREYDKDRHSCPRWNRVIRQTVEDMKAAQPEPQWIPVSERLPEDLEEVNVTWVNRNPESYYESIKDKPFTATAVYYKGKWYWWSTYTQDLLAEYGERCSVGLLHEAIEITAWMPLPSPYQKGATT